MISVAAYPIGQLSVDRTKSADRSRGQTCPAPLRPTGDPARPARLFVRPATSASVPGDSEKC